MRIVTAEEVRSAAVAANVTWVVTYRCSICDEPNGFIVKNAELSYSTSCGCAANTPDRPRTWQDAADWINSQKGIGERVDAAALFGLFLTSEEVMRNIEDHKVNPANDKLTITVLDEPGQGGANHVYRVGGIPGKEPTLISFQNGPIGEDGSGVNGLTHEVLLAIVADRLRSFQKGPYACKANACALTHVEEAMHWLQQRTLERMRRGVEGTHQL